MSDRVFYVGANLANDGVAGTLPPGAASVIGKKDLAPSGKTPAYIHHCRT
jgi:hypothetical protein